MESLGTLPLKVGISTPIRGICFQSFSSDLAYNQSQDENAGQIKRKLTARCFLVHFWNTYEKSTYNIFNHDEKVGDNLPDDHYQVKEVLI